MKVSYLLVAITTCALSSIPLASARDKAAPAKPAMNMQMDAQMTEMQAHMQTMQDSTATMRSMSKPMMMEQMLQHQQAMESKPAR